MKLILILLTMFLFSCDYEDFKNKDEEEEVQEVIACDSSYLNFCTEVEGQLYYTIDEILFAHGVPFNLNDFKVILYGRNHAYVDSYLDYDGNFDFFDVEPGKYLLIVMPKFSKEDYKGQDIEGTYFYGAITSVNIEENTLTTIPLINPYKIYYDEEGYAFGYRRLRDPEEEEEEFTELDEDLEL